MTNEQAIAHLQNRIEYYSEINDYGDFNGLITALETAIKALEKPEITTIRGYSIRELISIAELLKRKQITVNDLKNYSDAFYKGYEVASQDFNNALKLAVDRFKEEL